MFLKLCVGSALLWTLVLVQFSSQIVDANDYPKYRFSVVDHDQNITCLTISMKKLMVKVKENHFIFNLSNVANLQSSKDCESVDIGLMEADLIDKVIHMKMVLFRFRMEDEDKKNKTYRFDGLTYQEGVENGTQRQLIVNETLNHQDLDLRLTNQFSYEHQGYRCGDIDFNLKETNIEIEDFRFIARHEPFNATTFDAKPKYLTCRGKPGSNLIPILVGSILLALMVVAFFVYLFFRRRADKS